MTREANNTELDFSTSASAQTDNLWQSIASSVWNPDSLKTNDVRDMASSKDAIGRSKEDFEVAMRPVDSTPSQLAGTLTRLMNETADGKSPDWTGFRKDLTTAVQAEFAKNGPVGASMFVEQVNDMVKGPRGLGETRESKEGSGRDIELKFMDKSSGTLKLVGENLKIEGYPGQAAAADRLAKIIKDNNGFGGPKEQAEIKDLIEKERDGGIGVMGSHARVQSFVDRVNESLSGVKLQGGLGLGGATLYLRDGSFTGAVKDSFTAPLDPAKPDPNGEVSRSRS